MHKVRDFDSNNVDEATSKRVREILDYHELDEVRAASNGAATFHVWVSFPSFRVSHSAVTHITLCEGMAPAVILI